MGEKWSKDQIQARNWLEDSISKALVAFHFLTGANRISLTWKLYPDGSSDMRVQLSMTKQRKPK